MSKTLILKKFSLIDWIVVLLCITHFILGLIVSLNRYWQFENTYTDFGIFDQAIWSVSRFNPPIIDHFVLGKINIFGDHFSPSLFLLSPIYWFTDRQESLLIVQAIFPSLSAWFVYLTGKEVLKNKTTALLISFLYISFIGLHNAIITDFHELTLVVFPLSLVFYAVSKKNIKIYVISMIIVLLSKETLFLVGVGVGIMLLFSKGMFKKIGIATIVLSVFWGLIQIEYIIPSFSGSYLYTSSIGNSVNLGFIFDHNEKRRTLFYTFLNFGFLSVFSPSTYFLIFQEYLLRFYEYQPTRWTLGLHYNALSAIIIANSCIWGLKNLSKYKFYKYINYYLALIVVINLIIYRFILHGPYLLAFNKSFYDHSKNFEFLNTLIKNVPDCRLIMSQNNLAPRLSHKNVMLLKQDYAQYEPDCIVVDARDGQSPNNYFGSRDFSNIIVRLKSDKSYKIHYNSGDQYIFVKNE